jgi:DUF1009 family protein
MTGAHVGHDAQIGNRVILVNNVAIAGHCQIGDDVIVGGLSGIHQWVRIGQGAIIGAVTMVTNDVIPYGLVQAPRGELDGLNLIGLKRRGVERADITALRAAYQMLAQGEGSVSGPRPPAGRGKRQPAGARDDRFHPVEVGPQLPDPEMSKLAIIAGAGGLPAAVVASLPTRPVICGLEGFAPAGLATDQTFRVERLAVFLRWLEDQGVTEVCFAGAVQRPALDPSLFDPPPPPWFRACWPPWGRAMTRPCAKCWRFSPSTALPCAEWPTSRRISSPGGVYAGTPGPQDEKDAIRAESILAALGAADIGQGCVVAGGLCLAVETLPGTDAMLAFVAQIPQALRPAKGLFYKAPKPAQDRRIDLPALGVQTVVNAAAAGLGGIVWAAGGVICLDLPAMQAEAVARGLFLWAR